LFWLLIIIWVDPSRPVNGYILVLCFIFGESWPPFFLLLVFLGDVQQHISSLGVPLGFILNDFFVEFGIKSILLAIAHGTEEDLVVGLINVDSDVFAIGELDRYKYRFSSLSPFEWWEFTTGYISYCSLKPKIKAVTNKHTKLFAQNWLISHLNKNLPFSVHFMIYF